MGLSPDTMFEGALVMIATKQALFAQCMRDAHAAARALATIPDPLPLGMMQADGNTNPGSSESRSSESSMAENDDQIYFAQSTYTSPWGRMMTESNGCAKPQGARHLRQRHGKNF